MCTVRLTLVVQPVFSPQRAVGSTRSANSVVSVRKASLTTTNSRSLPRISRMRPTSGIETQGLVPWIHSMRIEPISA